MLKERRFRKIVLCAYLSVLCWFLFISASGSVAFAIEPLVIVASPSVKLPLEALSRAFEALHPGVTVQIAYDSGLYLRQRIAAIENSGRYFIGSGPVHLVAPAVDELITRLDSKYYLLPGTRRSYAVARLVLVVPESLVDAPESFEAFAGNPVLRIAVADPQQTEVGRMTQGLLTSLDLMKSLKGRIDVAVDASGVLDHVLSGHADAGIVLSSSASAERHRVRIAAIAPDRGYDPPVYSIAMERYCPNRPLCEAFLDFVETDTAQGVLARMGYGPPKEHVDRAGSGR
ncbi:MAG: molybdate ABC transporter substrate-binding protein [Nitrospira sp.]|nr:molybdate ABC transporter substrate-binding protein [Nitrospira sp.]